MDKKYLADTTIRKIRSYFNTGCDVHYIIEIIQSETGYRLLPELVELIGTRSIFRDITEDDNGACMPEGYYGPLAEMHAYIESNKYLSNKHPTKKDIIKDKIIAELENQSSTVRDLSLVLGTTPQIIKTVLLDLEEVGRVGSIEFNTKGGRRSKEVWSIISKDSNPIIQKRIMDVIENYIMDLEEIIDEVGADSKLVEPALDDLTAKGILKLSVSSTKGKTIKQWCAS